MTSRRDLGLCPDFPPRGAGNLQGAGQRVRVAGPGCTWLAGVLEGALYLPSQG